MSRITVRRSAERGHAQHGWLESRHSFSFADYYDPAHMGFSVLRVINEDWIAPGGGFPLHPHRDMEIITVVLEGELAHQDTLGNATRIVPGEVQRMTAGTGIRHAEYNGSSDAPVHLLQIWILPEKGGLAPGYAQKSFADAGNAKPLVLAASRTGEDGSLVIHQDAKLWLGRAEAGAALALPLGEGRRAWLQVVSGRLDLAGVTLAAGDAAAVTESGDLPVTMAANSQFLWFDLP